MVAKRIIPCLDVKNDEVVKGFKFNELRFAGDPVELAKKYDESGADELVFLDITASLENRDTILQVVEKTAQNVLIPFTVGGGIRSLKDMRTILNAGADKVSINSAAVKNPDLINKGSNLFGSQCIVVAIDTKKTEKGYRVFINGGNKNTEIDLFDWVKEVKERGAGEILLTSIDHDGSKDGFDDEITRKVFEETNLPIIASGGAGAIEDFYNVLSNGKASGALAASIFHYEEVNIKEVKEYLDVKGIEVRL
ncbi:imidazole glycerol phosphate synthase subunit HisF [Natranaerobius trueperi]|uniref:Imidazole glycerol phosphate synthase subunit HisF n=1 Tax=Natranaerobius trueperi TaxID=759412 RepID=A0A226BZK9_9FIRM|nr:imidazole glycerol phosphate synthase subunit HisF [Natranaerobius trueperi]OWZ83774.1 imidazole glycerol phosphate synthase subunit HisF [Natranaerobius trueperi]